MSGERQLNNTYTILYTHLNLSQHLFYKNVFLFICVIVYNLRIFSLSHTLTVSFPSLD
jgi:hypothetical protein